MEQKNNCITCAGTILNGRCQSCGNYYGPVKPEVNLSDFKSPEARALAYKLSRTEIHNTAERIFVSKQLKEVLMADAKGTFDKFPGPSYSRKRLTSFGRAIVSILSIGSAFLVAKVLLTIFAQ